MLVSCSKESSIDFNQAPAEGESSQERAESIREAFKEAPTDNPASEAITRDIQRTFTAMAKAGHSYDVDATLNFIDFESLFQVMNTASPNAKLSEKQQNGFVDGIHKGARTRWFQKDQGIFDWIEVKIMRVETSEDDNLALVYARHFTTEQGADTKARWWLHHTDQGWRIYDWEYLDTSIRMSRLLLAGRDALVEKGSSWTKSLPALQSARKELLNGNFQQALDILTTGNQAELPLELRAVRLEYIAICYRSLGKPANALQSIESALRLKPDFPDAVYTRARIQFDLENYEAARADFEQYLHTLGSDADALTGLADCLTWLDKNDEAKEAYRASLRDQPTYDALLGLAYVTAPTDADELAGWFSKLSDPDVNYDMIIVELYDNQGMLEVSEAINEAYRKVSPDDTDLAWYTARIALDHDDPKKAAATLKPAIERAPDDETQAFQELYWMAMARAGESTTALREAGRSQEAFEYLADECHDNWDGEALDALCEEFREGNEEQTVLHFYLAEADFIREDYLHAEGHFRVGYKLAKAGDPLYPGLVHGLLDSMNSLDRGNEGYVEVGKTKDAFAYLAGLLFNAENSESLQALIEAHAEVHADDLELVHYRGELAWLTKDWKQAAKELSAYLAKGEIEEISWWVLDRCVRAAIRAQDYELAESEAKKGLGDPDNYLLIVVSVAKDSPAAAMQAVDTYLAASEDPEDAGWWVTHRSEE
ncbi:MAG: tetratricopeptide repeat protein, partial [Planctomycetes bacterium]|nr:tetratricopeptide repeat protein [Planctomycetota bacterium]